MTRKEYIYQLAQEIINMNKPMINRIVTAEVDKIKAQLAIASLPMPQTVAKCWL